MDDCLSAVDAHVGKSLFDDCISGSGVLAGKTRILVTHQLQFVSGADWIVVLDKGKVQHQGTYSQLIKQGLEFDAIVEKAKAIIVDDTQSGTSNSSTVPPSPRSQPKHAATEIKSEPLVITSPNVITIAPPPSSPMASSTSPSSSSSTTTTTLATTASQPMLKQHKGDLTQAERMAVGRVSKEVYKHYMKAGGGLKVVILLSVVVLTSQSATVASDLFLANWSSNAARDAHRNMSLPFDDTHIDLFAWRVEGTYVQWYATLVAIACGMLLCRGAAVSLATAQASKQLFNVMFSGLMRAPQSFFDSTPSGRIINRFSKDQDIADTSLPLIVQVR
jgi:ABC-type multidrug transport system fused ATPase/permease subunit